MNEWQPIETAPRDGTSVLVYCARFEEVGEARWYFDNATGDNDGWFIAAFNRGAWRSEPTHWMPMPGVPEK